MARQRLIDTLGLDRVVARLPLATVAAALASLCCAMPAAAQTDAERGCRSAIAKETSRYVKTLFKTTTKCHVSRNKGKISPATDCGDVDAADTGKLGKARAKLRAAIGGAKDRCSGSPGLLAQFARCPSPAADIDDDGLTTGIDAFPELADCLIALSDALVGQASTKAMGSPGAALTGEVAKCQKELGKGLSKLVQTVGKERARCQAARDAQGQGLNYGCVDQDPKGKINKTRAKVETGIAKRCALSDPNPLSTGNETLDALGACGDTVAQLQDCIGTQVGMRFGSGMIAMAYELPDSCRAGGARRVINASAGRKLTATGLDAGWSGLTHGVDIPDQTGDAISITCDADCANCDIDLDPLKDDPRSFCRCAGNTNNSCDVINGPDPDDCTGLNTNCICNFGPPLSISSGGTPVCVVNQIRQDYEGTVDIGTGQWSDQIRLASLVHLGISSVEPCPTCQGDVTSNDGIRDGTCQGGLLAGTGACDVNGIHPAFGPSSFDCPPNPITNISGGGLLISLDASNEAQSLPFALPCDAPPAGLLCPCRVCSGNANLGCASDDDCAAEGAGTCTAGGGAGVKQNACSDGVCSPDGQCTAGPIDTFCDGVVTPKGEGFVPCSSAADCSIAGAGACTLSKRRLCYTDPIVTDGEPGTYSSQSASIFCIPPTTSGAVNNTGGLPGAGRLVLDFDAEPRCASDPGVVWEIPGGSNCGAVIPTTTTTLIPPIPCETVVPPVCSSGGGCPPGQTCQTSGAACACAPVAPTSCSGSTFPTCGGGACPAGETCQLDLVGLACVCTSGTTCADTMFPTCGGSCPAGQSCQGDILGLACACGP